MNLLDNLILLASATLRSRTRDCETLLADVTGGDKHLAVETLAAVNALELQPSLRRLHSAWQMVRGLEGWVHHQSRIQKITGEKKTSKFL